MRPPFDRTFRGRFRVSSRKGFTIVELLIAATISLILTYAVVQMFDYVAKEARYGRASIELASQLRNASRRIGTDLACATAPVRPFADRHGMGYFEYLEGPGSDSVAMVCDTTAAPPTYTPRIRTSAIDGSSVVPVETSLGGDIDDVLMFTAFNPDEPFRGRYRPSINTAGTWSLGPTQVIESKYAEIVLWTVRLPNGRVNLHRRAFLIRPDLSHGYYTSADFTVPGAVTDAIKYRMQSFYQENDLAIRYDSTAGLVGNTLADLSRRENRFAHVRSNVPNLYPIDATDLQQQNPAIDRTLLPDFPGWLLNNDATNATFLEGNDVLLAEVLAFDVKAFDPLASIRLDENSFAMTPSDPGYAVSAGPGGGATVSVQTGAFVDLGYDVTHGFPLSAANRTWFSGDGAAKSKLVNPAYYVEGRLVPLASPEPQVGQIAYRTYCTWSLFYEMNARDADNNGTITVAEGDEDGNGVPDSGTNGIDDDNDGIVDEYDEWDTSPPYPYPMRGVQVTLRVMEPNSRQVRQMSVVQNFTGE